MPAVVGLADDAAAQQPLDPAAVLTKIAATLDPRVRWSSPPPAPPPPALGGASRSLARRRPRRRGGAHGRRRVL
eukprot:COSAG06_NODE_37155_length_438_cov_1.430678_1_plen_73_part_10